ncbi:Satratoxin biosynthesis SC1 cluster protein 4 [Colletotrichum sidae]|uniref:Satratoxin biosynthesis SC1 cluster protein 4 n=1 Tax=Colletotrichum sidae TaxID=1347389 RepID=A0A4R8TBV5_9PEZI|nr:Satratoxin biosynthesis SC1 cluster protein 4 [Colletotrichum sidae]
MATDGMVATPPPQYIPMTTSARDSLIAVCFLWVIFATVVFARLWGRFRGIGIGGDDVLAVIACLLSGSTIGLNAAVFTSGVGYNFDPNSDVYPKLVNNMQYILKVTFAFTLIYLWALASLKLSQLWFYHRAFALQLSRWIYVVSGIVVAWALVFTFIFIFLCDPIAQQWTVLRIGHCMDQILVLKCIIMTNVVTDLFIVILPIWTVWQLQMRKTEKVAVIACFALGLACCVIGIVRFWQIFVIDLIGNLTGTSLTTFMLCTVELMLAGLCINIPMLRPFYLRWRSKYKSSTLEESNNKSGYKGSHSNQLKVQPKPGQYTAWIELNDKDHETVSNDDGGSERKLTRQQPDSSIRVQTNWNITRE